MTDVEKHFGMYSSLNILVQFFLQKNQMLLRTSTQPVQASMQTV